MSLKKEGLRVFAAIEPLSFLHRLGWGANGVREAYEWVHSEEFIKGLRDRGFNLYIADFSKGNGIEAETDLRENTRRVVELCHRYGLYAGGYVRYTTFVPETMKREIPDCVEKFSSLTADGRRPRYSTQYWRLLPCPTSEEYFQYFDRLIGIGVGDLKLDCLHVDGMYMWHEPDACRCPRCAAAFRAWLAERYPGASEQRRRLGFAGLDHIEPPEFDLGPITGMSFPLPIMGDPLVQEWVLFRCHLLGRIWRFIVDAAHCRNPACLVQGNTYFHPYLNGAWDGGCSLTELVPGGGEGFYTEEDNAPNLTVDGRLHGYFETFKKLRRFGYQVFTGNREPGTHQPMTDPERLKRGMAHQMAFNLDSVGVFGGYEKTDSWPVTVPEYMAFHRDRRDLYQDTCQAHDVAIYFSERTRTLNCGTPIATSLLAHEVMLRGHVPFGFLSAGRLDELSQFRALVLPEVECLSDAEASALAEYVRNGGGLLVLGENTGRYDEFRILRKRNELCAALDLDWPANTTAFTLSVGRGRVAFLAGLLTPEGRPEDLARTSKETTKPYFFLRHTDWHHPLNAVEMLKMLQWAADGFRFELTVPDTVVVEFVEQSPQNRYLVHLVNFDLAHDIGPFELICRDKTVVGATAVTPDGEAPKVQAQRSADGFLQVRVTGFHRYLVLIMDRDPKKASVQQSQKRSKK